MSFGSECNFQDVYLLAYLLKSFGLEMVVPIRGKYLDKKTDIKIGSTFHLQDNLKEITFHKPIDINYFIDRCNPGQTLAENHSNNFTSEAAKLEELEESEREFREEEGPPESDCFDYGCFDLDTAKAESFDALTDGQYGDYEDWSETDLDNHDFS